jgi:putative glutamine amidotransferase
MKPVILVTTDRRDPSGLHPSPRVRPRRPEAWISEAYVLAVRRAGGVPILVAPGSEHIEELMHLANGVLLTGGHFDIHPSLYGEQVVARLDRIEATRTHMELALARACLDRDVPVLGVCGGQQALVVAAGGQLLQDIETQVPNALQHEQPTDPAQPWHDVNISEPAAQLIGRSPKVNSTHHQAASHVTGRLEACGWAPDGVIEAVWAPNHRFAVGVQWHPELLGDLHVYNSLISAAERS